MLDSYIIKGIEIASELLLLNVRKLTPEDTYELQNNNRKQNIVNNSGVITGGLINETPYAGYVEYGVGRAYNYYKGGGRRRGGSPFYRGVGARMYTKTQFENESKVRDIIQSQINEWIKSLNK